MAAEGKNFPLRGKPMLQNRGLMSRLISGKVFAFACPYGNANPWRRHEDSERTTGSPAATARACRQGRRWTEKRRQRLCRRPGRTAEPDRRHGRRVCSGGADSPGLSGRADQPDVAGRSADAQAATAAATASPNCQAWRTPYPRPPARWICGTPMCRPWAPEIKAL